LTTQWFPDVKKPDDRNATIHRMLLGTHTSDDKPNYVQIAEFEVPREWDPKREDYDDYMEEIGGFGKTAAAGKMKFNITQKIDHPGEVNKARYQPQNPDIIATMCVDGRILVFDRTKHSSQPTGKVSPQVELHGHKEEGFGLSWNPHAAGKLATGSEDSTVCLWDLQGVESSSNILKPARKYTHHSHIVNDVQYHPFNRNFIGTVSDDLTMQIIDAREAATDKAAMVARGGHTEAINALGWSPTCEYLFTTASGDKTIAVWDIRNVKTKIHTLEGHQDAVTSVSWHPSEDGVIASCSYDRRVIFWDLSRAGDEQTPEDAEDGPPEM
jgi:histone-binding protein RBBP4